MTKLATKLVVTGLLVVSRVEELLLLSGVARDQLKSPNGRDERKER